MAMAISAAEVKELRERTGAGMLDCKKALEETGGDMEAAIDLLRSRGAAKAAKRSGKETSEGAVGAHIDPDTGVAAMVELNCETDFVARTDDFQGLANELAVHAARAESDTGGVVDGDRLLSQELGGTGKTVEARVTEVSAKTGERVVVRRFARFASAGAVGGYVHMNGRIGVLVELSGGDPALARDVAMHIAASSPLAIRADQVPADVVARERAVYLEQVRGEGKPEAIQGKIVEGKLKKFFKESTLLEQAYVKDPDRTVADLLKAGGAEARRFARFELGA